MTNTIRLLDDSQSPFDRIRRVDPDGSEWWSARDLMPLMGYSAWRNFEVPLKRAMKSAEAQGINVENNFTQFFRDSGNPGPNQADCRLTRFACHLVAMNCDPNKPEVAAIQTYFVVRTREAETTPAKELTGPELMAKALVEAQATLHRAEQRNKMYRFHAAIDRKCAEVAAQLEEIDNQISEEEAA